MQKTIDVLKALTLVVTIMVGASLVLLMLQISSAVKRTDSELSGTFVQLNGAIAQMQTTAALGGKLVNDARLSTDNINKAAIDERFYFERQLPELMDQARGILGNVQTATADLDPLLRETTARTHDLASIETNAAELVADADITVRDPHIAASLKNLDTSTAELAVASKDSAATLGSVKAITADMQQEVHGFVHPVKKKGFWATVDGVALWIHGHILPPLF